MPREHARILMRIWADPEWCARSPSAQRLYFLLLSQKTINNAGVLPLMVRKWSRGSAGTSEHDIEKALAELSEHGFVVVDEDTDEVLVRSFIRNDGVVKQPNVLKNALRQARDIESPMLRAALATELRRIGMRITTEVAEELSPTVRDGTANPSGTTSEPVDNYPSETLSEPFPNPSESLNRGNPSEGFANPSATPAGMGMGMGMGMGSSTSVGGCVGEPRAHTRGAATPKPPEGQRPNPRCAKHVDDPDPPNCRGCANARRRAEAWDAERQTERDHLADTIAAAKRDPSQRCEHGVDGGAFTHPDTGTSATCALCRRTTEKAS